MWGWLEQVFGGGFMPHGHCYLWTPALVWLQVLSNASIGAAYVSISLTLYYIIRNIQSVPFSWMYLAFGVFIIACGGTHFTDVLTIWHPIYWFDGGLRAVTAVASVGTALLLLPLAPKAVALADSARLADERKLRLEETYRELSEAHARTVELERLRTEFFANVSHELRTPLALILGPTEKLLAADDASPESRHDLEVIARNARTLLKHVNDLLDVSKVEAGKATVEYARSDLARLLRVTAAHFEVLSEERAVPMVVDASEPVPAEVDEDKVERILFNLLSNAFKFTEKPGRVRCSARREGDGAVLEVADSGVGVRPEMRQRIFERFAQADGGVTRRFGGTGLGLAIARDFARLHGGDISVGDAPEGGALFTLRLPLRAPAGSSVGPAAAERSQMTEDRAGQALEELRARVDAIAPLAEGKRPLALVVEDNRDMNRFVCDTLSEDYRTERAFDGREGIDKAIALHPDVIVTDVMMPGTSGDEVVRALRRRREFETTPILVLTAKADDELRVLLLREGAQDYVMKPFSAAELRARVANLVTMKRVRDVLQAELEHQVRDLETLAREVTQRRRELSAALDAMRVARDHAERASQLKSDFLGMVSHELRTPLALLAFQLERLSDGKGAALDDRKRLAVERMSRATRRLTQLIESLLEQAAVESGRLSLQLGEIDLTQIASDAVDEFRPDAEHKGLTVGMSVASDLPPIVSDARLVRLVVGNLIANAVKFTDKGRVEVTLSVQDGHVRVDVSDTGPGIAQEDRARIFEPFAQLAATRNKHLPGVGLGLAIVRDLVGALGGRLTLDSAVGRGSTFSVELTGDLAWRGPSPAGAPEHA